MVKIQFGLIINTQQMWLRALVYDFCSIVDKVFFILSQFRVSYYAFCSIFNEMWITLKIISLI